MQVLQGIAVSPGIAIGESLVIDNEGYVVPRRLLARDEIDGELARLDAVIETVAAEINRDRNAVAETIGDQYGAIFSAHRQLLQDPKLREELEAMVRQQRCAPAFAVTKLLRRYARMFQQMDNVYMAERAHDLLDIEQRLMAHLLGKRRLDLSDLDTPVVILAHDLTPSQTARLDRDKVLGFVTEAGGEGGHTAILAKGLEIPAVVGAGNLLGEVACGDTVIVDGDRGVVILSPDAQSRDQYRAEVRRRRAQTESLGTLRDLPAESRDGVRIQLLANIEFPYEVEACRARGADGVGLYRTEFLYLSTDSEPTEQEHYEAYCRVLHAMEDCPVVIRTLDLGADKMGSIPFVEDEHNPCLGLRSIRLSLRNIDMFRTQLRAILRASTEGRTRLMFPLITTVQELRQAKLVLRETMEDLADEGIAYDPDIPIGMMVEVPAAVIMIDRFLKEVDFISIGTNDLTQYALAVDRSNKEVANLYHACDPAVLRLLEMTLKAARKMDVPVGACGQMSGEPHHVLSLLGLGLRSLSVPPSDIPIVKQLVRSVTITDCEAIARRALQLESADEVNMYLKEELSKHVPTLTQ